MERNGLLINSNRIKAITSSSSIPIAFRLLLLLLQPLTTRQLLLLLLPLTTISHLKMERMPKRLDYRKGLLIDQNRIDAITSTSTSTSTSSTSMAFQLLLLLLLLLQPWQKAFLMKVERIPKQLLYAVRFESNHINNVLMNQNESNRYKYNNNNKSDTSSCTTTTTTTTIDYNTSTNTSTYDDNKETDTAHSIHRTDKIKWFESISNNNNNKSISPSITNNINTTTSITTSTTTSTNNNEEDDFHISIMFKLIALYLIITKSISPKEFIRNPKSKHHHHQQKQRQQQEHYHVKDRHQFHLEQQQKHQHFKQQQHNVERMAVCIVLKLTLVAWDMWTYRNGF